MSDSFIPDDVAQFIVDKIDSVAQMEALLLFRNEPQEAWTVETLARRLYINENQTAEIVNRLCADGFLVVQTSDLVQYRYAPSSQNLRHQVDRVCAIYTKHLVPVTNLIHSKPKTRVQEFADAFRLRRDK
jgi:AraC-like DNA-binding protein